MNNFNNNSPRVKCIKRLQLSLKYPENFLTEKFHRKKKIKKKKHKIKLILNISISFIQQNFIHINISLHFYTAISFTAYQERRAHAVRVANLISVPRSRHTTSNNHFLPTKVSRSNI